MAGRGGLLQHEVPTNGVMDSATDRQDDTYDSALTTRAAGSVQVLPAAATSSDDTR